MLTTGGMITISREERFSSCWRKVSRNAKITLELLLPNGTFLPSIQPVGFPLYNTEGRLRKSNLSDGLLLLSYRRSIFLFVIEMPKDVAGHQLMLEINL